MKIILLVVSIANCHETLTLMVASSRNLVGGGCQHAAGVDGVLGGVRLGGRRRVVGRRVVGFLVEVRRCVVTHHTLVIRIRPLGRLILLLLLVILRMSIGRSRIMRVYLRWRFKQPRGLQVGRLQAVERRPQLPNEVIKGEVGRQVLGAGWWRRRRCERVRGSRGRQRERLPAEQNGRVIGALRLALHMTPKQGKSNSISSYELFFIVQR